MMELKVWVEGIQRIICGVTEYTTCQDIVYALAHATGQTGRFTLIERWRNNERLLAPHEHPLKILNKWGEYSNDVQFVLERTSVPAASPSAASPSKINANAVMISAKDGGMQADGQSRPYGSAEASSRNIKKSLTISTGGGYQNHRVVYPSPASPTAAPSQTQPPPPYREPPSCPQPPPYRAPPSPGAMAATRDITPEPKLTSPTPEQEDMSPNSASVSSDEHNVSGGWKNSRKRLFKSETDDSPTTIALSPQYKELLRLVNQQRDKLGSLQADLTKYDAEITFWEGKTREQQHKAEFLAQESGRLQETNRMLEDQMLALKNIEEEKEISKQQSKTLKSEMTLLRSKLANCETELLQCKIKIRHLLEEIQLEQRAVAREEAQAGNQVMEQIEQLQKHLDEAKIAAARDTAAGSQLDKEVELLESLIEDKKQQVEQLVKDMKEANLLSLSISPATDDGIRSHLLEGVHKGAGSSRRMIGSPRQLENAVATSKNPHGVWV